MDDLKFDMRIYVLLASVDPLRIFIYEEGLARLATETYCPPTRGNLSNLYMHLTNYAIQKTSIKYCSDHKRPLAAVWEYLQDEGEDVAKVQAEIEDVIIKTILMVQPSLKHTYRSC